MRSSLFSQELLFESPSCVLLVVLFCNLFAPLLELILLGRNEFDAVPLETDNRTLVLKIRFSLFNLYIELGKIYVAS
jgi:hypothetical protein